MQLGIFAKTFAGSSPEHVLQQAKAAGFETVQYNMACSGLPSMPDDIPPRATDKLIHASAATGISVAALSATYNMIHPSTDERAKGHRRLGVLAAAAAQARIPMLTLCTGTRNPDDQWAHHPQNNTRGAWRDLLHSIEIALSYADKHDLLLGIEPERANVVSNACKAQQLLNEIKSPRIRIVLDPANLVERETPDEQRRIIADAIDRLGPHIAMAHAKDRNAEGDFVAPGKGVIDFPHFIRELRKAGLNGPLVTHGLSADEAPGVSRFLHAAITA